MIRIARNMLFSTAGFAVPVALSLFSTPIILHGLGEDAYGIQALAGNITGYLVLFNLFQTAGTKYVAEYVTRGDHEKTRNLLGTLLLSYACVGLLGAGVVYALAQPLVTRVFLVPAEFRSVAVTAFELTGVGVGLTAFGWWGASALAGMQRFGLLNLIAIAGNASSVAGSLAALALGRGLVGVMVANVASLAVTATLYAWTVHRLLPKMRWLLVFDSAIFRQIAVYGFYNIVGVVFGVISSQVDRTLLGSWIGMGAVTVYTIPLKVATYVHQLCGKVLEIVLPLSSTLDASYRTDSLRRLYLRAQNLNVVMVTMLSVPLIILAPQILTYWIDTEFASRGTIILQLLTIAYALIAFNVVAAGMGPGLGHPELNTGFGILLGLTNLAGYLVLIPLWGAVGAAVASATGSLLTIPVFILWVNRKTVRIPLWKIFTESFARPLLAGGLVGFPLLLLRPLISNLALVIVTFALSCALYALLTVCLGVWETAELELIPQVWQKLQNRIRVFASPN